MALADTARLIVQLALDDKFSGPAKRVNSQLSLLQRGGEQMGRGLRQVTGGLNTLGTRAALVAAGGLTAVVKTAVDFEDAWAGVEKTVNETDLSKAGLSFEKLQQQFRDMAREIPVSFEELAAIGEQAGALGIAAGDITKFTDVVAKLGVTTDLTSDQAATALGQLGNVLHLSGQDFNEFADSLVNLGNQGASTESQIIEIAARFGAAGNQAGLSKEEILGFSSAVASMGINVEAGGSALSRIFNSITTNIGLANDKSKAFAKVIGEPFAEFKKSWDRNASGTFQDFLVALGKMDKFKQASVLKSIGITNTRDINAIQLMAQNTKELARQLDVAKSSAGALNKEAEKRFATTASAIQKFQNILRDIGFVIGKELLPVINEALADLTAELAKPENQKRIADFAKNLAQGAKDLVAAFKRGDFNPLIENLKGAAAVAKTAFDAFNALPGPVKQFAIAALVANKVTGGAVGQIAGGLSNLFGGAAKIFLGLKGQSPANPMFVSVVGGGLGGPGGVLGAAGKGGLLVTVGRFLGLAGAAGLGFEIGKAIGQPIFDNTVKPAVDYESSQFAKALERGQGDQASAARSLEKIDDGLADLYGVNAEGRTILSVFAGDQIREMEAQREQLRLLVRATPSGQFVPQNPGGTPGTPSGSRLPEAVGKALNAGISKSSKDIQAALKEGDIHAARAADAINESLHSLRGTINRRVDDIIPHLGRVNSALSTANRNLDDGNARQRETAARIAEARDRIGNGFAESNRQLGIVASKDFSPNVNVTTNVSTAISISDVIRNVTHASFASQVRHGFTEGLA